MTPPSSRTAVPQPRALVGDPSPLAVNPLQGVHSQSFEAGRKTRNAEHDRVFPTESVGSTSKLLEQLNTFFPFGIFLELQQLFGALEGLP